MGKLFLILFVIVIIGGCAPKVRTSSDAERAEIVFVELPQSSGRIQYWSASYREWVLVEISEAEFVALFPEAEFHEIRRWKLSEGGGEASYVSGSFGDPENAPHKYSSTSNGLIAEVEPVEGGFITLVYDRDQGLGSIDRFLR